MGLSTSAYFWGRTSAGGEPCSRPATIGRWQRSRASSPGRPNRGSVRRRLGPAGPCLPRRPKVRCQEELYRCGAIRAQQAHVPLVVGKIIGLAGTRPSALSKQAGHDVALDVGQPKIAAGVAVGQPRMIQAQ